MSDYFVCRSSLVWLFVARCLLPAEKTLLFSGYTQILKGSKVTTHIYTQGTATRSVQGINNVIHADVNDKERVYGKNIGAQVHRCKATQVPFATPSCVLVILRGVGMRVWSAFVDERCRLASAQCTWLEGASSALDRSSYPHGPLHIKWYSTRQGVEMLHQKHVIVIARKVWSFPPQLGIVN